MKTAHTPGPWGYQLGAVVDSEGYLVADIRSRWDDGMEGEDYHFANAALIAAAPDLLEAAQSALDCIMKHIPATEFAPRDCLRAAIAKARGES